MKLTEKWIVVYSHNYGEDAWVIEAPYEMDEELVLAWVEATLPDFDSVMEEVLVFPFRMAAINGRTVRST